MPLSFTFGGNGRGKHTETAGTAIVDGVGGRAGAHTYLSKYAITVGATAHTLTVMRDASQTYLTAAAAAGQAVINVAAALTDGGGNAIASGDYVAVRQSDGSWHFATFSSAATLAYTLGSNLTVAAAAGAPVFCFGVVGDAFHTAQHTFALGAAAQTVIPAGDEAGTIVRSRSLGAPLICSVNNATNASTVDYIQWEYGRK